MVALSQEAKSFNNRVGAPAPPLEQALAAELQVLGQQVIRSGLVEGAMRLRALAEIEAALSTSALFSLAAEVI